MKQVIKEAIRLSFPVMVGYVFLGFAFGLLCQNQGYSWIWALLMSTCVYAGSMQFVLLTFFHAAFSLIEAFLVTLSVNARQIFYGISFLKEFQTMGKKKWYMIFSLTDETYSLLCAIPDKEKPHGKQLMFCISLFDRSTSKYDEAQLASYFEDELAINDTITSFYDKDNHIHDILTQSLLPSAIPAFLQYQNMYGANALLSLSLSMNESALGKSTLAFSRNNVFGHAAYDSDVEKNASRYQSTSVSVYAHDRSQFVS